MTQLFLSDVEVRDNLFPFTLTRSAADIRVGILTIREKWNLFLGREISIINEKLPDQEIATVISANIIPSPSFVHSVQKDDPDWNLVKVIQYPWHIFLWNDWAIREDFAYLTAERKSIAIPSSVQTIHPQNIFIEEGAKLSHCIINAEHGPVYIGRNAEVMEGAIIRGPVALCEGSVAKMGARIYGATTVGPYSVVGGEVKNSVIFGYSNKAHDGYLGDSVIGEWCNLGAGTSNSNIKNTAGEIKIWNETSKEFVNTGIRKCGVIMGDYSRTAINTSINTGTLVGVSANIFGEGLTPGFIPSFSWGSDGVMKYDLTKAINDIGNWKKLKGCSLNESEKTQLKLIFEQN